MPICFRYVSSWQKLLSCVGRKFPRSLFLAISTLCSSCSVIEGESISRGLIAANKIMEYHFFHRLTPAPVYYASSAVPDMKWRCSDYRAIADVLHDFVKQSNTKQNSIPRLNESPSLNDVKAYAKLHGLWPMRCPPLTVDFATASGDLPKRYSEWKQTRFKIIADLENCNAERKAVTDFLRRPNIEKILEDAKNHERSFSRGPESRRPLSRSEVLKYAATPDEIERFSKMAKKLIGQILRTEILIECTILE